MRTHVYGKLLGPIPVPPHSHTPVIAPCQQRQITRAASRGSNSRLRREAEQRSRSTRDLFPESVPPTLQRTRTVAVVSLRSVGGTVSGNKSRGERDLCRSDEDTSELQAQSKLVCRVLV